MQFKTHDLTIFSTEKSDLPDLLRLWNDGRVMCWVGFPNGLEYSLETMAQWLLHLNSNPDRQHFVIRTSEREFCGELYYEIDRHHRMASLDIKLVPDAQGKGFATQSLNTLINHIFQTESDLELVWVEPRSDNVAAQRLYQRCGMQLQPRPLHLGEGESYWELKRSEWLVG